MNFNTIIMADFETGSVNAKNTQPTQLAAIAINPRKLEIIEDSVFNSYIHPIFDKKKQKEYGLGDIEPKALEITNISLETLHAAPPLKVVWKQFEDYVNQFNPKKTLWGAPICAGFNNNRFDDLIFERIMGGNKIYNPDAEKEPYKFGPWDDNKKQGKLFHPRDNIDILRKLFGYFENNSEIKSLSMDNMRKFFGISMENSHNAIKDILDGAFLLIKFMKLERHISLQMKNKFPNSFTEENKAIARIMAKHPV